MAANIWGSKEHVNSWLESDTPIDHKRNAVPGREIFQRNDRLDVESVDDSPVGELRWDGGDQ